jgi:hypothetical protein
MGIPDFAIGEWLVCPSCGCTCDAPFHPPGSQAEEPELVLGTTLPQSVAVPGGEWRTEVAASCPRCGRQLRAEAVFRGHTLHEFTPVTV